MNTTDTLLALAKRRFGASAAALQPEQDFFAVLGIDSLQALDLLTDVEEAFNVEIPDYELQEITTLSALADVIGRRL